MNLSRRRLLEDGLAQVSAGDCFSVAWVDTRGEAESLETVLQ